MSIGKLKADEVEMQSDVTVAKVLRMHPDDTETWLDDEVCKPIEMFSKKKMLFHFNL